MTAAWSGSSASRPESRWWAGRNDTHAAEVAMLPGSSRRVSGSISGSRFGVSPQTLWVEVELKLASGTRSGSPRAGRACFTPRLIAGAEAAQSCDGCAAVWTHHLNAGPWPAKDPLHAFGSPYVEVEGAELRIAPLEAVRSRVRRRSRELFAHVVLDAEGIEAGLDEVVTASEPMRPPSLSRRRQASTPAPPPRRVRRPRPTRRCPRARGAAHAAAATRSGRATACSRRHRCAHRRGGNHSSPSPRSDCP